MIKDSKWNKEKTEELVQMYLERKLSTMEMAKKLGVSKNAIVGKIHRLRQKNLVPNFYQNDAIASDEQKVKKAPEYGQFQLSEISYGMCVWPEGEDEFLFCGKPVVPNMAYCKEHFALVYLDNKKVPKKKTNMYTKEDMEDSALDYEE